ncbi:hypothetical protein BDV97DRAFT_423738 [Delphinella strobiligena]|nr:hypothetical protein BDV97DRAFT_423738 [Delphinella strobiligena]
MLTLLGFEYDPSIDGFNNSSPPVPYPIYPELGVPTPLTVLSKVSGEERSNLYPIHLHTWQEAPMPATISAVVYRSNSLATLASENGDSCTTFIYTATDEVVKPQHGILASAFFGDLRGVDGTDNEI